MKKQNKETIPAQRKSDQNNNKNICHDPEKIFTASVNSKCCHMLLPWVDLVNHLGSTIIVSNNGECS